MPDDKPKTKTKKAAKPEVYERTIRWIVPDDLPLFYANNAGLRITPWDFRLTFGRMGEEQDRVLDVHQVAAVYMSPQHAKSLFRLLGRQISVYERDFGTITEPEVVQVGADGGREGDETEGSEN